MKNRMGENITAEWNREVFHAELKKTLDLIKTDREEGARSLVSLAESGSVLAMVYLGDAFISGKHGFSIDANSGANWLRISMRRGSIEGAYNLAYFLLNSGELGSALRIYEILSNQGYSPAQYVLGRLYCNGKMIIPDCKISQKYLAMAAKNGHYFAKINLYNILVDHKKSSISKLLGIFKKLIFSVPYLIKRLTYPNSDAFRH